VYEVFSDQIHHEVRDLPPAGRQVIEELILALSLAPWNSEPAVTQNPQAELRFRTFETDEGFGFIYFVIVEHAHEVVVERLIWSTYG
jgi:hypothetical protein